MDLSESEKIKDTVYSHVFNKLPWKPVGHRELIIAKGAESSVFYEPIYAYINEFGDAGCVVGLESYREGLYFAII